MLRVAHSDPGCGSEHCNAIRARAREERDRTLNNRLWAIAREGARDAIWKIPLGGLIWMSNNGWITRDRLAGLERGITITNGVQEALAQLVITKGQMESCRREHDAPPNCETEKRDARMTALVAIHISLQRTATTEAAGPPEPPAARGAQTPHVHKRRTETLRNAITNHQAGMGTEPPLPNTSSVLECGGDPRCARGTMSAALLDRGPEDLWRSYTDLRRPSLISVARIVQTEAAETLRRAGAHTIAPLAGYGRGLTMEQYVVRMLGYESIEDAADEVGDEKKDSGVVFFCAAAMKYEVKIEVYTFRALRRGDFRAAVRFEPTGCHDGTPVIRVLQVGAGSHFQLWAEESAVERIGVFTNTASWARHREAAADDDEGDGMEVGEGGGAAAAAAAGGGGGGGDGEGGDDGGTGPGSSRPRLQNRSRRRAERKRKANRLRWIRQQLTERLEVSPTGEVGLSEILKANAASRKAHGKPPESALKHEELLRHLDILLPTLTPAVELDGDRICTTRGREERLMNIMRDQISAGARQHSSDEISVDMLFSETEAVWNGHGRRQLTRGELQAALDKLTKADVMLMVSEGVVYTI